MATLTGLYCGRVEGVESGSCEARIYVSKLPGGCLAIDYEAVGPEGLQHAEHTIVDIDALYVAHSESPAEHVFTRVGDGVFDGPAGGPYDRRLVVGWDGELLTWSWHWAPAGAKLCEQSQAETRPAEG